MRSTFSLRSLSLPTALALGLAPLALAGCGDDGGGPGPVDPDGAPREPIDRFSDDAGTLHVRADDDSLPAPNAPIDFDASFRTAGLGPSGGVVEYYDFDVQPQAPAPIYVLFRDGESSPVEDQLNVVDVVPGGAGYNDFWRVHQVTVPPDFVANTVTSFADIEANGFPIEQTDTLVNCPIVPEGSTATLRAGDAPTGLVEGWYRGRVVNYFQFSEAPLEVTTAGDVPLSQIYVMFQIDPDPEDPTSGAASGFLTEPGTDQTHNVVATLPGDDGYSPLWAVNVLDNDDFASVMGLQSAVMATLLDTGAADVNCPVVSLP